MNEPSPELSPRPSAFVLTFAGALLFLYLRTFVLPAAPLVAHDDQLLFFVRAARIVHGQALYRDLFELVPPGADLLYAAGFRIFGVHAWVMQAWCIALGFALFAVVTHLAATILRGSLALLPGFLFLVFDFNTALDPTHHWYSTLAALMAVAVLAGATEHSPGLLRAAAAGALCALATLFTQTQGALTFAAIAVYLAIRTSYGTTANPAHRLLRQLAALTLPFLLILGSVLGYYAYKAGVQTLYFDLAVFPLRFLSYGGFNTPRAYLRQLPPLHRLTDSLRLIPALFVYAAVPYAYFFGLYRLWRERRIMPAPLRQRLLLLHLVGIALFLAVVSGPRLHRLCTIAPPAFLVCVWLLNRQGRAWQVARIGLWTLTALFAVLLPLYRQSQPHVVLSLPIGRTAFTDPQEAAEVAWLAARTRPGDLFFNQPALGLYLALENPAAFEFLQDGEFTRPEQVAAAVGALSAKPPRFIVLAPPSGNDAPEHDHSAPFRRFVHDRYRLAQTFPLDRGSRYEEIWEIVRNPE